MELIDNPTPHDHADRDDWTFTPNDFADCTRAGDIAAFETPHADDNPYLQNVVNAAKVLTACGYGDFIYATQWERSTLWNGHIHRDPATARVRGLTIEVDVPDTCHFNVTFSSRPKV